MFVAYNKSYGGYGVAEEVWECIKEKFKEQAIPFDENTLSIDDIPRHHPVLIEVIKMFKESSPASLLDVDLWEIDDDKYILTDYDGAERVHTPSSIAWNDVNDLNGFVSGYEKLVFED